MVTTEMPSKWQALAESVAPSSLSHPFSLCLSFSRFLCPPQASAHAQWPTLASVWSPIMHSDGCVSTQPDVREASLSEQQAKINCEVSPGNRFLCWSFCFLCLSDYLILSLVLAVIVLSVYICVIFLSLLTTFSTPHCAFSCYLVISSSEIYLLSFSFCFPLFPDTHSQAGAPQCTLNIHCGFLLCDWIGLVQIVRFYFTKRGEKAPKYSWYWESGNFFAGVKHF